VSKKPKSLAGRGVIEQVTSLIAARWRLKLMQDDNSRKIEERIAGIYAAESRRVFATLMRLLGDFDRAEEALHEAFAAALKQWPSEGIPANARAWLVSAGRYKSIDALRRRARFDHSLEEIASRIEEVAADQVAQSEQELHDDQLRLIFTCCHPALSRESQIALTLREVCGLTTEEIARAFLIAAPTLAQRIVRAKAKIQDTKIPYAVPAREELGERMNSVLSVVYLIFNEGYSASFGESVVRADLSAEAIRLGRLLAQLLLVPEVLGLLALMLLQDSRRLARTSSAGDIILLEDQDRSRWNQEQINEGKLLVEQALASDDFGSYTIQAAIAAVHAVAKDKDSTDWNRIVELYDELLERTDSPVVELNRAVAVAMRDGPNAGLDVIESILERNELTQYHLLHAARADLFRRLNRAEEAKAAYSQALSLTKQEPERRFLLKRLEMLK